MAYGAVSIATRFWICCWLIASCIGIAVGQPTETQPQRQVTIPINILDKTFRRVVGISEKDISVSIDKQTPAIWHLKDGGVPRHIVLLLDISDSMVPSSQDLCSRVATSFISLVPETCSLAMMTFSSRIIREVGFDKDRRLILDALSDRSINKRDRAPTRLFDAVQRAVEMIDPVEPGDSIFLFSDAEEARSKTTELRLRNILIQKQIRLFTFLIDYSWDYRKLAERLCVNSGGMPFAFDPAFRLSDVEKVTLLSRLTGFYGAILSFYQLEIELPRDLKKNAKISVKLDEELRQSKLSVIYSKMIPAN